MFLQVPLVALLRKKTIWRMNNHAPSPQLLHRFGQFPPVFLRQMLDHVERDASVKLAVPEQLTYSFHITQNVLIVSSMPLCFFKRWRMAVHTYQTDPR
jgi:hypothetical protein